MTKDIRVRYAPSPTGLLHIGNARTALFNYLYARHHGGTFIIRIEDTDRKRHVEDGERSQLENLRWLGMDWDESPETHENYRQSERLELYQKYIDQLLAEGKAYKSYVTEEELAAERERQEAAGETSQNVKQLVSSQLFVWLSMSLVSTNGMIWSKVISSLKVATSAVTG